MANKVQKISCPQTLARKNKDHMWHPNPQFFPGINTRQSISEMGGIYYPFHILTLILVISLFVILGLPGTKHSD